MKKMSNGLVGHVDGRIREGFNDPILVPRQTCAQTVRTGAGMFLQPVEGGIDIIASLNASSNQSSM